MDQMNEKYFMPRGLVCLIMKYSPGERASQETVDMSQTITKSLTPSESGMKKQLNSMKSSSGKTHGELEMPEAAPLIFPDLDAMAAAEGSHSKKKSGLKKTGVFLGDYFDRRAQASYVSLCYMMPKNELRLSYNRLAKTPTPNSQQQTQCNQNSPLPTAILLPQHTAARLSHSLQAAKSTLQIGKDASKEASGRGRWA